MSGQAVSHIRQLLATADAPALGPEGRAGVLPAGALNTKLDTLLAESRLPTERHQLIRAILLLWHDHLDESHDISQGIANADGSFLHAIMHRREPDYWNSKYWFRRAGEHPSFPEIAVRVARYLMENKAAELAGKLLPDGRWDPYAFVDACEVAEHGRKKEESELLRQIQRMEFEVMLDRFLGEAFRS